MKYDTDHPLIYAHTLSDSEDVINRVMAAFGIELTPEECGRMFTVGDLYASVLEKLGPGPGEGCVSQAAFHRVRRVLMDYYGAAREAVRPESRLLDLAPALGPLRTRRREWKALSGRLECYLPDPGLSRVESSLAFMLALSWIACTFLVPLLFAPRWWACWSVSFLFMITLVPVLCAVYSLFKRFAPSRFVRLPAECATLAGLVRTIAQRNYGTIARRSGLWNAGEIWKVLSEIIVEEAGVKPVDICMEARLGEDLGID